MDVLASATAAAGAQTSTIPVRAPPMRVRFIEVATIHSLPEGFIEWLSVFEPAPRTGSGIGTAKPVKAVAA
ncbi:hypothetical protein GCM10009677_17660 [Sphaerisporangium rubeum]|uniref:Uncharacterized protein n=1 Tax=Sphaerisporangium rubeum TaxID=321317 RepID=A0A7X0M8H2_9ACTN|nr:hypothetical protein [Sphaerisporangium rubeum]MBB6475848.1 hypothetical protein [Sphaerisporangium rubeum]